MPSMAQSCSGYIFIIVKKCMITYIKKLYCGLLWKIICLQKQHKNDRFLGVLMTLIHKLIGKKFTKLGDPLNQGILLLIKWYFFKDKNRSIISWIMTFIITIIIINNASVIVHENVSFFPHLIFFIIFFIKRGKNQFIVHIY